MNLKIGDKVRFLNSVGGGEVVRFINKEVVSVLEEDGFETPILIKECVIIESNNRPIQAIENSAKQTVVVTESSHFVQEEKEEEIEEVEGGDILNVYLAYLPHNIKNMQETDYDSYLLNDSNYYLMINIMSATDNGWISRFNGIVEPQTQLFIEEIKKEQLNELERITVQLIAYKKKAFTPKTSFSVDYKINTVKFYKLHSFTDNPFFDEAAMLLPIIENDQPHHNLNISSYEIETAIKTKEAKPYKKRIEKQKKQKSILEIDLHIHELLDNTNGLSNSDMLHYQLDKFHEVMRSNLTKKGQRIVFIHGKGEGILRNALMKELKSKYKNCSVQDASFKEYGFGATMVTIH